MNPNDFATDDMKSVVDKILRVMNDSPESPKENHSVTVNPRITVFEKPLNRDSSPNDTTSSMISPKFEEVYARMQAYQKKHDHELQVLKEKHEESQRMIHTHTPTLSEKTRQLIGNISPLHSRYKEEASRKEKRMKDLRKKFNYIKEEEIKKELTFTPKTTRSNSNIRSAEEYYKYMKDWKESREKIEKNEREVKEEKALDGYTFKPKLNKNSEYLTRGIANFEVRLEKGIVNREAKLKEKKSVSPCSFRPELQTKYKKLELGPVFNRLYPNHIKQLSFSNVKQENNSVNNKTD